jgi:predicted NBD/HSP70 family sugar kinase
LRRYSPDLEYSAESFDRFLESLDSGETASLAAIGDTARYLSVGVSNIAFALNPQVIIVAGRLTQAWRFIEPVILQQLDSTKLRVTVQTARYNSEELFLHGAVRLALNRLFGHRAVGW